MRARLLFLLLFLGCKDTAGVDPNVIALHNEYAAWRGYGLTTYEMTYQRECFCDPALMTPTTVRVVDGEVVAAIDANGKQLTGNQLAFFRTIDQTFQDLIEASDIGEAYFADLQFDDLLHYPKVVDHNIRNTADAGFVIHISNVVPYQPTPLPSVTRDVAAPVQTDSLLYHLVDVHLEL